MHLAIVHTENESIEPRCNSIQLVNLVDSAEMLSFVHRSGS